MIIRFRKGEFAFYRTCLPKELKEYVKDYPENKKYVEYFLDRYKYNYVKNKWTLKRII